MKKKVNLKIQIPSYKYIYGVKKKNPSRSKVSGVHLNCVRSFSGLDFCPIFIILALRVEGKRRIKMKIWQVKMAHLVFPKL